MAETEGLSQVIGYLRVQSELQSESVLQSKMNLFGFFFFFNQTKSKDNCNKHMVLSH